MSRDAERGDGRELVARELLARGKRVLFWLRACYPSLGSDDLQDAVTDAVIDCLSASTCSENLTDEWLYRASWRNAANTVRSQRARRDRERDWHMTIARTQSATPEESSTGLVEWVEKRLPDDAMRKVYRLWLNDEHRTHAYVTAMDMRALPRDEQVISVKRAKDRLKKHLRRVVSRDIESFGRLG